MLDKEINYKNYMYRWERLKSLVNKKLHEAEYAEAYDYYNRKYSDCSSKYKEFLEMINKCEREDIL